MIEIPGSVSGAIFSEDRNFRYALWRRFSETENCRLDKMAVFIGLNPSTADENLDDPTIRRCRGFAKKFGADGFVMANLFAFRATNPDVMKKYPDPVGPDNDLMLVSLASLAKIVICCWGVHGSHKLRSSHVRANLRNICTLYHLGMTKNGLPKHPLYLKRDTQLSIWT